MPSPIRFSLDSNIFLRIGDPELTFQRTMSMAFLRSSRGNLGVGPLVVAEVTYQLKQFSGNFRQIPDIKHWLFQESVPLVDEAVVPLIDDLQREYAANGWYGDRGDNNDRIHVATASAFRIPYFVTWEDRIHKQQAWVSGVNAQHGLNPLSLVSPDTYLNP